MNERKAQLIKSGMTLFVQKGYHNTSIQEITTDAGMSKGSFYTYFKSKEDFIARSFYYFHQNLSEQMMRMMDTTNSPRDSLANQVNHLAKYVTEHKNFIIMHLREDISIGEDMAEMFQDIKLKNYRWMYINIKAIYGDQVDDYVIDLIIQFEGLMNAYLQWFVLDDIQVDQERIGAFLVERLDSSVEGMLKSETGSIIHDESALQIKAKLITKQTSHVEMASLKNLREAITALEHSVEETERLHHVVDLIASQLDLLDDDADKATITIQGLLVHFKDIPEMLPACEALADDLEIDLLY